MNRKYTDNQLKIEFEKASSLTNLAYRLGLKQAGGSLECLKKNCDRLKLDWKLIKNQSGKGTTKNRPTKLTLDEMFTTNSPYKNNTHIKTYYLKNFCKDHKCSICGLENKWNGSNLTLILDHIDGDRNNHSLTNLRLVCPNCNSQLPTHAGRNKNKF